MKLQFAFFVPAFLLSRRLRHDIESRAALTGEAKRTRRWGGPAASLEITATAIERSTAGKADRA